MISLKLKELNDQKLKEFIAHEENLHAISFDKLAIVEELKQVLLGAANQSDFDRIQAYLLGAKKGYFDSITEYHEAEIETAKFARDAFAAEHRSESPEAYDRTFGAMHENKVFEAEEKLRIHLDNEERFYER